MRTQTELQRTGFATEVPGGGPHDPAEVFAAGLRLHAIANTAYPIAHRTTIWPYRQPRERHRVLLADALSGAEGLSLYAHVPFCERRCAYCEYTVVEGHSLEQEAAYFEALQRELELYLELLGRGRLLRGFDLGGGTPSLCDPARVAELCERVGRGFRPAPGFQISIETTPAIAARAPEKLGAYRAAGIDRISMGLQTVSPRLLRDYGRDGRPSENRRAVENIRAAGFPRFNIDLMYGFVRQSPAEVAESVAHAIALAPEVITLYQMRYKGTRVEAEAGSLERERVYRMYAAARSLLLEAGYRGNPGKNTFSRIAGEAGTSAYLSSRVIESLPYLGLGLGAQTFSNTLLAYNHGAASKRLERYLATTAAGELPIQDLYHLPIAEGAAKMAAVSFYFGEINLGAFRRRFGLELEERFSAEVVFLLGQGLMAYSGAGAERGLRLTEAGAAVSSGVIALFYSDRVKQHLIARCREQAGAAGNRAAG
jgi:oxygen-independent coproporphyrinogen-3 oxidase